MPTQSPVVIGRARKALLFGFIAEEKIELLGFLLSVLQLVACPGFLPQYYDDYCAPYTLLPSSSLSITCVRQMSQRA